MDKLGECIEIWARIAQHHMDTRMESKDLLEIRIQQRLHDEAMHIVAALRRYKVELDNA